MRLPCPKRLIDLDIASEYCTIESFSCRVRGDCAILSFDSEEEGCDWEEGEGWLASLMPLRSEILHGDLRSLYLGWLVAVQEGMLDDDVLEPPVSAGLGELSASLESLSDFLRINPDLIDAAAEKSAPKQTAQLTRSEMADWIGGLPSKDKDAALMVLLEDGDVHSAIKFRQRAIQEILNASRSAHDLSDVQRRSVGQLMARAESIAEQKRKKEAESRAREKAKREREQAEQRRKYIESLVGKEELLWSKVDALVATRQPNRYDEAVSLLQDLHEVAAMTNQDRTFSSRIEALCREHARKPSLLDRIRKAGLLK